MFSVNWEERPKITEVPDSFITGAMKDAPGEYVKIFLYLLMLSHGSDETASVESLSHLFSCTQDAVLAALKYWEKQKLLDLYYRNGDISGIRLQLHASERVRESHRLDQHRVKAVMKDNGDAARLLFVTEQYFGRPLTAIEVSTLLYFLDELGFSFDLCDYLVQYCVSRGHTGIRYIEKVGLGWHKNGYTTPEEAKAQTTNWSKVHFEVLKAFGIRNRNPVPKEIETIDRWTQTYGFSIDIITEACTIALTATGKQSYEYAEAILSRWHAEGVRTLEDARRHGEAFKNRQKEKNAAPNHGGAKNQFHNFPQRDDDLDELERRLDRQFAENT